MILRLCFVLRSLGGLCILNCNLDITGKFDVLEQSLRHSSIGRSSDGLDHTHTVTIQTPHVMRISTSYNKLCDHQAHTAFDGATMGISGCISVATTRVSRLVLGHSAVVVSQVIVECRLRAHFSDVSSSAERAIRDLTLSSLFHAFWPSWV